MIREALELIFDYAEAGKNPCPHQVAFEGRKRALVLNGDMHHYTKDPPRKHIETQDMDSFCRFAAKFASKDESYIVVNYERATCVCDVDHRTVITLELTESDQMDAVSLLSTGVSQKVLVRMLRTSLNGCYASEEFLKIARQMSFNVDRASRGAIDRQAESMGRSVEKRVRSDAGDLPDQMSLSFSVFDLPDFNTQVTSRFAIDVDYEEEKIRMIRVGRDYELSVSALLREMVKHISDITLVPTALGKGVRVAS